MRKARVSASWIGIFAPTSCTTLPVGKCSSATTRNEIGASIEDLTGLVHPDERDRVFNFQNDFLEGTAFVSSNEFRLRHKDGSYRWIVAHALAFRNEQGRACRLVGSHGRGHHGSKTCRRSVGQERQSLWHMLQASDHERQIISYEIHDGLAQYLAAAAMQFQATTPCGRTRRTRPRKPTRRPWSLFARPTPSRVG